MGACDLFSRVSGTHANDRILRPEAGDELREQAGVFGNKVCDVIRAAERAPVAVLQKSENVLSLHRIEPRRGLRPHDWLGAMCSGDPNQKLHRVVGGSSLDNFSCSATSLADKSVSSVGALPSLNSTSFVVRSLNRISIPSITWSTQPGQPTLSGNLKTAP